MGPGHWRTAEKSAADVVNLGYVVNVIEDPDEATRSAARSMDICASRSSCIASIWTSTSQAVAIADVFITSRRVHRNSLHGTSSELQLKIASEPERSGGSPACSTYSGMSPEGEAASPRTSRHR